MRTTDSILVIACGAIAHEVVAICRMNHWDHLRVQCLPADLHNEPQRIPAMVRELIEAERGNFDRIFVAYGDCGTGGALDEVLNGYGIERLPGAHCYEFFAGRLQFETMAAAEPGTFYLTDFLARHFDRLVIRGLGLDRHPQLRDVYFGNYRRLVYLSQNPSLALRDKAREAALRLGLGFEYRHTGYGELETELTEVVRRRTIPVQPASGVAPLHAAATAG